MSRNTCFSAAAGLLVLLLAFPAFSQNISAVLTGTVKDPAGSVVPNAQITLTNEATRGAQTLQTNESGVFVFSSVLPGSYLIDVSVAGFRSHQVRNIGVTANERRSLGDIMLQVGQLQERIEVTAEITPVQTASSERYGLVSGTQLLNALIRGRDFVSLIATLPGIVDMNAASREVSKGPGAGGLHINGGRDTSINFALDGVQNTD
ncbi:MAG: carboxypeptidase-like regulatory domain-containing protein, partial [Acidobacteria bacterium]|nr:carboxypeptidase-like regulatory domain-containing protein [Acidobacteriota bacterium]